MLSVVSCVSNQKRSDDTKKAKVASTILIMTQNMSHMITNISLNEYIYNLTIISHRLSVNAISNFRSGMSSKVCLVSDQWEKRCKSSVGRRRKDRQWPEII